MNGAELKPGGPCPAFRPLGDIVVARLRILR